MAEAEHSTGQAGQLDALSSGSSNLPETQAGSIYRDPVVNESTPGLGELSPEAANAGGSQTIAIRHESSTQPTEQAADSEGLIAPEHTEAPAEPASSTEQPAIVNHPPESHSDAYREAQDALRQAYEEHGKTAVDEAIAKNDRDPDSGISGTRIGANQAREEYEAGHDTLVQMNKSTDQAERAMLRGIRLENLAEKPGNDGAVGDMQKRMSHQQFGLSDKASDRAVAKRYEAEGLTKEAGENYRARVGEDAANIEAFRAILAAAVQDLDQAKQEAADAQKAAAEREARLEENHRRLVEAVRQLDDSFTKPRPSASESNQAAQTGPSDVHEAA